ncbi:tRNA-guanine transglycosylase DpdA [Paracidovorax wautersii]|uniref:tRNA-guanine family transglycosylase n=1 Tax=Paracidovorax wautersii TaxID=1177982 RepID=A0A1I2H582_9BURK|nr:tRNA-guanine transglycosylase DpdA [Paracidovorax wautersii]SFF24543.1 hypothetical protein SAMN04489711_11944 [Paracidovorax wautersii]
MKFIYADSIDQIDPDYDFVRDRSAAGRKPYWSDLYPHEYFPKPPYDGVLVSRGIVGDSRVKGKYSDAHAMRFRREGARAFLRMDTPVLKSLPIYGDCGAFTYVNEKVPPYSAEEMSRFYAEGQFTHGCSVDHIIFGFRPEAKGLSGAEGDERERFDITQENASVFLKATKGIPGFTPLGAIQGWSPDSMAEAARQLEKMGYDYLAVGGMVPLAASEIHLALRAIRSKLKATTRLHILGFAKAEQISEFYDYGIESFDTTSPLYRAFMDAKSNYYVPTAGLGLKYYTAIRVPLAVEDPALIRASLRGELRQEDAAKTEQAALTALRAFDAGKLKLQATVDAVMAYQRMYQTAKAKTEKALAKAIMETEDRLRVTLEVAPWKDCTCRACREAGIEVMIFRSSNRNKRRGFHNLHVYSEHVARISGKLQERK